MTRRRRAHAAARPRWRAAAAGRWRERQANSADAYRAYLLDRADTPLTALRGHRAFAFVVFAFGLTIGLGIGLPL